MLTIRPFRSQDAAGVAALILPIQQQEFGIAITIEDQPDLHDIAAFYQHGSGNFWVAEGAGAIVGTVGLLDIGDRQAALRKMFVAAPYRGREHGVASRLLGTLVAWARAKEIDKIYLGTTDRFLGAHRFYEKNGFAELPKASLPRSFPVMQVDSRFYALSPGECRV